MEAPVPASALIHSATLVSAGIYLLLRFNFLLELSYIAITIIKIFGVFTAFYGGMVAAFQSDTKKLLAYSTISHCGFLMVVYSSNIPKYTILYLLVHGFFKALTFLCMGNVNRFNRGVQDFRKMGNLYKYLPFECLVSFICLINLAGLPLTFGFFIKHFLFVSFFDINMLQKILYIMLLFSAIFGIFYSYRLFYNVFFDFKKNTKHTYYTSSRIILKSKHYTNTTLMSTVAICLLFIAAYISIMYYISLNFSIYYFSKNFSTNYNYNSSSFFFKPDHNFLLNFGLLN